MRRWDDRAGRSRVAVTGHWGASLVSTLVTLCALTAAARAAGGAAAPVVLMTADGEGHVQACATCPTPRGLGGLDRRATALAAARRDTGAALLLDAVSHGDAATALRQPRTLHTLAAGR